MAVRNLLSLTVVAGTAIGIAVAHSAGQPVPGSEGAANSLVARVLTAPAKTQTLASDLIGATAYGRDGAELGTVRDLVFGRSGQIVGMVVGVGGFFGIGEKHLAVPFTGAEIVKNRDGSMGGVRIELSRTEAETAPAFRAAVEAARGGENIPDTAHVARTGSEM